MEHLIQQLSTIVLLLSTLLNGGTHEIPKGQILATSTVQAVVSSTQIQAIVTKYSGVESCHHENCIMASGRRAYIGAVACPPEYKFNTKVLIDGVEYSCQDRTARWVQERNGPTFDIFNGYSQEAYHEALRWGKRKLSVYVLRL